MNITLWDRVQTFLVRLQSIDRRVIYGILLVVILIPMFFPITLKTYPSKQSQDFYDTVERIARESPNKLVIIDGQWSPSTRGENQWQTQAIVTHLMARHLHFATLTGETQNNTVTQTQIVEPLTKKFGYVYGRDYVSWGYRPPASYVATIKGLVTDIPGTIKKDYKGAPITQFEVMKGIKTRDDISALVEITPAGTVPENWLGLFEQNNKPAFLFAPTAVMAPTYYPYLDTGQMAGMLTGIKGAGDYEGLLIEAKLLDKPSFGTRAAGALSLVYALIILLIILGNIGYYAGRAARLRRDR
jgi:hypothetical protein